MKNNQKNQNPNSDIKRNPADQKIDQGQTSQGAARNQDKTSDKNQKK